MTTLFTIGYEGASVEHFLKTLAAAGVESVLDIRQLPQSRRPGFSKNSLSLGLAAFGIGYRHIKQLGDPKHGRDAARAGRMDEFRQIFEAHMDLPASREAVAEVAGLVSERPTVLLCYERDPKYCHRSIVAQHISGIKTIVIKHLGVQSSATGERKRATATTARYA